MLYSTAINNGKQHHQTTVVAKSIPDDKSLKKKTNMRCAIMKKKTYFDISFLCFKFQIT